MYLLTSFHSLWSLHFYTLPHICSNYEKNYRQIIIYCLVFQHTSVYRMTKTGWSSNNVFPFCNRMLSELRNSASNIPTDFFMFGETHWGGCGCLGASYNDNRVKGVALGFKFGGVRPLPGKPV